MTDLHIIVVDGATGSGKSTAAAAKLRPPSFEFGMLLTGAI